MKKLYCYVDETGQDTEGRLFIVCFVVVENKDIVTDYLQNIEIKSGKGKFKWGRAEPKKRLNYVKAVLKQKSIYIYFSIYKETKEYKTTTILTIAKSIKHIKDYNFRVFNIYIDGLSKKDEQYYGAQLHRLGIHSKKVKGVKRDESNELIRFTDSMCGFIRDIVEGKKVDKRLKSLYLNSLKSKILVEL
jgi:hypothetical protein